MECEQGFKNVPGVPDGWELVALRVPKQGEMFLNVRGEPQKALHESDQIWPIIRKIEKPKQYRPFANAEEFKPHRDRWICRLFNGRPEAKGCYKISAYDDSGTSSNDGKTSYREMFEEGRAFDDGTPFGVEVTSE
jgi:hypothetical protein